MENKEYILKLEDRIRQLEAEKAEIKDACASALALIKTLNESLHQANNLLERANNTIAGLLR